MGADGEPELMAFMWMDRNRRFFIATASCLAEGKPYSRARMRQVNREPNALPEMVDLKVPQPQACEIYYSSCGKIDAHNRCRQDDLDVEKKFVTLDWSKRVNLNLSIWSMCVVDAWVLYRAALEGTNLPVMCQNEFYTSLAHGLIKNHFGTVGLLPRSATTLGSRGRAFSSDGQAAGGVDVHLTPTKRRKKKKGQEGDFTKNRFQGRCCVGGCSKYTTYTCSACGSGSKTAWLCTTTQGRDCFAKHAQDVHYA